LLLKFGARAQPSGDATELAKAVSNPVADLVSVPFQFNWEQGVGYQDATRVVMNVQPVVPFMLNDDWNLIARWIMPFVSQPRCRPDLSGQPDGQQGHEVRTVPVPDRWRFRLLRRLARDRSGAQDQIAFTLILPRSG
jgi:hypothetical protein